MEEACQNFDHDPTIDSPKILSEAKQPLFNAYDRIKGEELMEKVQRVQAAQIEHQHSESWRVINEMCG